jgi:T5SS/PEP-CTERM-associated repeat protein
MWELNDLVDEMTFAGRHVWQALIAAIVPSCNGEHVSGMSRVTGARECGRSEAVLFRRRLLGTTSMAALGLVLATSTPSCADDNWTGATSTDWFTATNWSAGVPNAADTANIDTVAQNATVVGATGAQANTVLVGNSGTGTLTIQNGGNVSNVTGYVGYITGSTGTVTVDGAGSS